ncbi:hypothetical protein C8Q80DRAFT_1117806 [Daedaleopsis nitida]|nr:hypothetical protein C8Q80DRAFT_1117806 [Daedaleopsis nitida]
MPPLGGTASSNAPRTGQSCTNTRDASGIDQHTTIKCTRSNTLTFPPYGIVFVFCLLVDIATALELRVSPDEPRQCFPVALVAEDGTPPYELSVLIASRTGGRATTSSLGTSDDIGVVRWTVDVPVSSLVMFRVEDAQGDVFDSDQVPVEEGVDDSCVNGSNEEDPSPTPTETTTATRSRHPVPPVASSSSPSSTRSSATVADTSSTTTVSPSMTNTSALSQPSPSINPSTISAASIHRSGPGTSPRGSDASSGVTQAGSTTSPATATPATTASPTSLIPPIPTLEQSTNGTRPHSPNVMIVAPVAAGAVIVLLGVLGMLYRIRRKRRSRRQDEGPYLGDSDCDGEKEIGRSSRTGSPFSPPDERAASQRASSPPCADTTVVHLTSLSSQLPEKSALRAEEVDVDRLHAYTPQPYIASPNTHANSEEARPCEEKLAGVNEAALSRRLEPTTPESSPVVIPALLSPPSSSTSRDLGGIVDGGTYAAVGPRVLYEMDGGVRLAGGHPEEGLGDPTALSGPEGITVMLPPPYQRY